MMKCYKCGYEKNRETDEYCLSCGEKLKIKDKKDFLDNSLIAKQPEKKICEYCKTEVPFTASVCPNCRHSISRERKSIKYLIISLLVGLCLYILSSVNCVAVYFDKDKIEDTTKEYYWRDY